MRYTIPTFLVLVFLFTSCKKENKTNDNFVENTFIYIEREPLFDTLFEITADAETTPIPQSINSDAADDPAVWIHPSNPSLSFIIGSDKKGGIATYNLSGQEISYIASGKINNVDVAYNIQLQGESIDICGGTNRSINAIDLYKIDPQSGALTNILDSAIVSTVNDVYGFCFYHSQQSAKTYAILCGKNGVIEHYEILEGGNKLNLALVSSFDIGTQPEGLVADHKHGYLYIGEENKRIWRTNAEPGNPNPVQIANSTESDNANIEYDIEGLTIFYTSSDYGYLIASSQGNNTYALFDRTPDNAYIGSFKIADGIVDGTQETDGIDVLNLGLGNLYPKGVFIVQDGINFDNGTKKAQNYKMVNWEKISSLFEPALYIDPNFNVRSLFGE